jgi:hypothetical protein
MTDEEFETLDREFRRLLHANRKIPPDLLARLAGCRDCDRPDPESYMVSNGLWRAAVPSGRGRLCLACLTRRLGRHLHPADFGSMPIDPITGEPVPLAAGER